MNDFYNSIIIFSSTIISTALYVLKKKNIYNDFNAFELSVYEIIFRSLFLLVVYLFYNFDFSFDHTITDYSIIISSTLYGVVFKFIFFDIIKNTDQISIISTFKSIIGIIILFFFEYLFLNKEITYSNIFAIAWLSIGIYLLFK